jgi:hypothetical protein
MEYDEWGECGGISQGVFQLFCFRVAFQESCYFHTVAKWDAHQGSKRLDNIGISLFPLSTIPPTSVLLPTAPHASVGLFPGHLRCLI